MDFDLLAAARDLIAADSVSAHGNARAIEVLARIAHGLGLETVRHEAEALGVPQTNLVVHPKGAPPRDGGLLLVTHTDTVSPGPLDLWTETDPFVLKQDGDVLYGLGVADVKLDALAKLQALAKAPATAHGKVGFLGTFAEEVGCLGARHFVTTKPFVPRWASAGEPSELRIIDAHKGYLVARILVRDDRAPAAPAERLALTFDGKAAHSSTPHLGKNAIERALGFCEVEGVLAVAAEGGDLANKVPARAIVEVPARSDLAEAAAEAGAKVSRASGALRSSAGALRAARLVATELRRLVGDVEPRIDERFDPRTTVFNNGVVHARDGVVELTCDARLLPGHDPELLFARLDAFADELARREGLGIGIARERSNPAMALPARSVLRDAAMDASRSLGLDPTPQAKPTNTEGGVFVSAGIEAIVFGPGRSTGNAHTANERQSLAQLREAARWYAKLVENLCA